MADLENGLWPGGQRHNPNSASLPMRFVTAMVKGNTNSWAVKGNDATQGSLQLFYDGPRPQGYQPMKKQGAIVLGIGGDNSNGGIGTFYEGVMTQGYSSDVSSAPAHSCTPLLLRCPHLTDPLAPLAGCGRCRSS